MRFFYNKYLSIFEYCFQNKLFNCLKKDYKKLGRVK